MNPFIRDVSYYVEEADFINDSIKQSSFYLSKRTGKSLEAIEAWQRNKLKSEGDLKYIPPTVAIATRDERTGDRRIIETNLGELFLSARERKLLRSPSLAFYLPPETRTSTLSEFTTYTVDLRNEVKQEMFAARGVDKVLEAKKDNRQNALKTRNNAGSGAAVAKGTILHNKSTHSALTGVCRSAAAYGTANNEKLLGGKRHYYNPTIVMYSITSSCILTDFDEFSAVVDKYNLYMPNTEDVMDCIRESIEDIWAVKSAIDVIHDYVAKLTPLEKAAFVYIGDLYHLRKHNPQLLRDFLGGFIKITGVSMPESEWEAVESVMDSDIVAYVPLLRKDLTTGTNLRALKKSNPTAYGIMLSIVKSVIDHTVKFSPLIRGLLTTKHVPASIARLPEVIRRITMLSDTDSTMPTAQEWSKWYIGEGNVNGVVGNAIGDTIIYISSKNIAHLMARMSCNMGVTDKKVFIYAMKNEIKFGAFSLTGSAKNYFSSKASQEGTTYTKPALEVKGVGLRSSNMPVDILNEFHNTLISITKTVSDGDKINLGEIIQRVADHEHRITAELLSGDYKHLNTGTTKDKGGYVNPLGQAYFHHLLWEECFSDKYGHAGELPYGHFKLKVVLNNKTDISEWVESIKDPTIKFKVEAFFSKYKRTKMNVINLPESILEQFGVPIEFIPLINVREASYAAVKPYYLLLDSLGFRLVDKKLSRMLSDYYPPSSNSITG